MIDIQNANQLSGLWSAIPMPWSATGELEVATLEQNISRLALVPCDGIYTTDSDGEFYALELPEFREFVATFAKLMQSVGCGAQVGVTWTNTQGIIDRIRTCLDHGISTVHICYPYWMPMNADDVQRFWDELATKVPASRWIHYSTPRGHVQMRGADYRLLANRYPDQFIGTKLGSQNFVELSDIIGNTPELSHFVTDYAIVPGRMLGARGVYSFWVNTLPRWHRQLLDRCAAGDWAEAMAMQKKLNMWETHYISPLVGKGYLHGIVGKARGAASGFLQDAGFTRPPYGPVPAELREQLANDFQSHWNAELEAEQSHESWQYLRPSHAIQG